jgi:predicted membrane protein
LNANPLITVLAIIGGLIVLGIVLKVAFALIGLAITVGIILVLVYFIREMVGGRR